jgi:hypothetical protein
VFGACRGHQPEESYVDEHPLDVGQVELGLPLDVLAIGSAVMLHLNRSAA